MSKKTGVFTRIFQAFRNQLFADRKGKKVGEDHLGNVYYLREADRGGDLREKRYVEPLDSKDPTLIPETPVEWEAWLRYRRNTLPTQEEINKNLAITMRTLKRASELEEKDYLERGETMSESQSSLTISEKVTSKLEERKFPERPGLQYQPGAKPIGEPKRR